MALIPNPTMKKTVLISVGAILLLIVLVISSPFLFRKKIERLALNQINQSVDAVVAYNKFTLSIFKSFPDFTATFHNLSVIGMEPFAGDTLVAFGKISATVDIKTVFSGGAVAIKSVVLSNGLVNIVYNEAGLPNWNIAPIDTTETSNVITETTDKKALELHLTNVKVEECQFRYSDYAYKLFLTTNHLNGHFAGNTEGWKMNFDIMAQSDEVVFEYDSIKYLNKARVAIQTAMEANLDTWDFRFLTDRTLLNGIPLTLMGGFSMPTDTIAFNLDFSMPGVTMVNLLALLPDDYKKLTDGCKTEGDLRIEGNVKGNYINETFPSINLLAELTNGKLQYPGLPESVNIGNALLRVRMPEGPIDSLEVDLDRISCSVAGNTVAASAYIRNLFGDMLMDVSLNGKVNLESLKQAVPLDKMELKGNVLADIHLKGNSSHLAQNRYDLFKTHGNIDFDNLFVKNETLPQGVFIRNASVLMINERVEIKGLTGNLGASDFALSGILNNPIKYFMNKGSLSGKFQLRSNRLDMNEFFANKPAKAPNTIHPNEGLPADSVKKEEPLVLPKNIDMVFTSSVNRVLYNSMDIRNFEGDLLLNNQTLILQGLKMEMLEGVLTMQGSVVADGRPNPDVQLALVIRQFDLPTAFNQIDLVKKFIPIAENSEGSFSTTLNLTSKLGANLKMILQDLTATGSFSSHNMRLTKPEPLNQLTSVIQTQKLNDLTVKDFTAAFQIVDGNLKLNPFKTEIARQPASISGTYNLGGKLDFRVDATLEKEILSTKIQDMIAFVPGSQKVKKVDVGLDIKGDSKKPTVKVDEGLILKQVKDQIKQSSPQEIQDAAKKLLQQFLK
jgi:hypothetical protein